MLGHRLGKVFQLSRLSLAFDFRGAEHGFLFISIEPNEPRLYMIQRRVRDLEKQSLNPSPFTVILRKHLSRAELIALNKDAGERVVRLNFRALDEMENERERTLIAQLTGRASNLLLLDENAYVIDALREPRGPGQEVGEKYQPPPQAGTSGSYRSSLAKGSFQTLSEAADAYYQRLAAERAFQSRAAALRASLNKEAARLVKLKKHLASDLAAHGDADEHRRIGELLLANLGTATRNGVRVTITDYYAEDAPRITLEIDEHKSLQEESASRFARYSKAKRAAEEIARRLAEIEKELEELRAKQTGLERIISAHDEDALASFDSEKAAPKKKSKQKTAESIAGVRRYRSTDGFEILVGRAAKDNDHLTFRLARPSDLWLHAADYPGSHVIVRRPTRQEIPQRAIIEAAELAAYFSQAKKDSKVDVHYTERKFLSKPKGSAPGLVRLSSFRTLTVEPQEKLERI